MNQPHQIPIVNTKSESSVEFDPSLFGGIEKLLEDQQSAPCSTSDYKTASITSNMSHEEHKIRIVSLKKLHNAIKAELDLFSPKDLTEAAVSLVAGHLESIKQLYVQFSSEVNDLEDDFPHESALIEQWKTKLSNTCNDITKNRKELMEKKQSFAPNPTVPAATVQKDSSANTSIASTDSQVQSQLSLIRLGEEKALSEMIIKAEDDCPEISAEIGSLEDDLKEHDSEIRIAMKEVDEWKKRRQSITKAYRKYISLVNKID